MDPTQTAIHGDFHRGNLFFRPGADGADGDCAVIDWSFYGTGHCSWELPCTFAYVKPIMPTSRRMSSKRIKMKK